MRLSSALLLGLVVLAIFAMVTEGHWGRRRRRSRRKSSRKSVKWARPCQVQKENDDGTFEVVDERGCCDDSECNLGDPNDPESRFIGSWGRNSWWRRSREDHFYTYCSSFELGPICFADGPDFEDPVYTPCPGVPVEEDDSNERKRCNKDFACVVKTEDEAGNEIHYCLLPVGYVNPEVSGNLTLPASEPQNGEKECPEEEEEEEPVEP